VDGLNLLGVMQDVGQLSGKQLLFLFGQLELRKRRDAFNVCDGEYGRHWVIVIQNGTFKFQTRTAAKQDVNRVAIFTHSIVSLRV
jgi:hypothetical protein